jgi:hypothetical protein
MPTQNPSPAILDAGVNLTTSYGGLALGFVLCTVFWSFLVVQTCAPRPPGSYGNALKPFDRIYCQMKSVPHCAKSTITSPNANPSFSHDAWPLRILAWTMLAIGTTFEILYLSGRAYSPNLTLLLAEGPEA